MTTTVRSESRALAPAVGSLSESTILELFEQQVIETPAGLAVVFEDRELSFLELNHLANQFANGLQSAGVVAGECIGLCIDRCPEAIAAMLGAFKLGAVFVPLDPEYPLDRIEFMIGDAAIRTIVTHGREANPLAMRMNGSPEAESRLQWIDSACAEFGDLPHDFASIKLDADDLAYVMYTSGSTGKPKGVQIEHRALTTYCLADIEVYRLTASDRTLQFSTLNFDIAIEEIFPPLLIGSAVVVRPAQRADTANELSKIIDDYGITAIHMATAYWHEWVDLLVATRSPVPASLRLVIATGEKVSVEHYRRWQSVCRHKVLWCNAYGPTEATVTATVFIPDADFALQHMPIGKPLPGYEALLLDEQLKPVSIGETAHLFLAGPALARGYLNRSDLTEKAFVYVDLPQRRRLRLYRTGDLARMLPDGNIEFAGRVDHQIKLGSYRIEPGEIEAVLNKHGDVLESLVVHEQIGSQKYLIAYVAVGQTDVRIEDLQNHLAQSLPAYMVPPRYVLLERLPKTINGKVDRSGLPDPKDSQTANVSNYSAPRTDLERQLADLWAQVLQVPQVGISDDFFALGGSSLLVTRIISELTRQFEIELPVRDFFANPTIASSAGHIQRLLGNAQPTCERPEPVLDLDRLPLVHADFIARGDRRIFAVRYEPRREASWRKSRRHGLLICNSLGHEYTRSHRNLQQLAQQLCVLGFDVLRFDYAGTGNSNGSCSDCRMESLQADVRRAAEYFREVSHCEQLSVLGIRMGATLAATAQLKGIERLILWDPILRGSQFLQLVDRFHQHALSSQTRYAKPMPRSATDQAYGYAMNEEKRSSFKHLQIGAKHLESRSPDNTLCILSEGYRAAIGWPEDLGAAITSVETRDQIYWQSPEYAESAFSSPAAFQATVKFLCGDER